MSWWIARDVVLPIEPYITTVISLVRETCYIPWYVCCLEELLLCRGVHAQGTCAGVTQPDGVEGSSLTIDFKRYARLGFVERKLFSGYLRSDTPYGRGSEPVIGVKLGGEVRWIFNNILDKAF